ncbi:MAG: lipoyl domain-containing protein [Candidatus Competibacteraceae bacterium]|nr:lipoyl domain-containing protein [Candidatus Competibacteraceae bacterium]MCB1803875.1 lipoyl domain-containing protein [Candidatus Competibacteraceae bacterium]MCB1815460.1 lipoyl domain-containing protein [Candidatus Competibacteraceae bacterium]
MSTDIIIPQDLYEEDEEAAITNWLVSDGAAVEAGALIAEIMTAKVQYEIQAPASGTIKILKEVDDVVAKGGVIGRIE